MPSVEKLPASIASIAAQNAGTVGVSHDFYTHMRLLLPKIESILGALARQSVVISDPDVIRNACFGIIRFLNESPRPNPTFASVQWTVLSGGDLSIFNLDNHVTLILHRVVRLVELLELHFILSVWTRSAEMEHTLAGWIIRQLEQNPVIPEEYFAPYGTVSECNLKIRASDEDSRQTWKTITDAPLRLSFAYVATVSPKRSD
jgi:hypothetical protein